MSQIIVDTDRLGSYSSSLNSKKEEFVTIKNNMIKIINNLNSCWQGEDCKSFVANATAYLEGLKSEENNLNDYSNIIKGHQNQYQSRVTNAMSMLG